MAAELTDNIVYIPVIVTRRIQFGKMIFNAMPGILLMLSVVGRKPGTVGEMLLNIVCLIAGLSLIFVSVRSFRKSSNFKGFDTVSVFTGFLLIAQGSLMYDAYKGFQPASLYFVAATIFIFKGVMLPESGMRRGFFVSETNVVYRKSPVKSLVKINRDLISDISLREN